MGIKWITNISTLSHTKWLQCMIEPCCNKPIWDSSSRSGKRQTEYRTKYMVHTSIMLWIVYFEWKNNNIWSMTLSCCVHTTLFSHVFKNYKYAVNLVCWQTDTICMQETMAQLTTSLMRLHLIRQGFRREGFSKLGLSKS